MQRTVHGLKVFVAYTSLLESYNFSIHTIYGLTLINIDVFHYSVGKW